MITIDKKLDRLIEAVIDGPLFEQSLPVEPEDDLNAAEGLDALEEEVDDDDADESEQET